MSSFFCATLQSVSKQNLAGVNGRLVVWRPPIAFNDGLEIDLVIVIVIIVEKIVNFGDLKA